MSIDPATREKKSLKLLDEFPWDSGSVVIGGYSIVGYGAIRYSRDLDIVIPKATSGEILNWFSFNDYSIDKVAVPNPQNYNGNYVRLKRDEVTIDLLIGAVRDREAQVDIPEKWITENTKRSVIRGLNSQTQIEIPLARPEAIWALKLQAGRYQDLTDLFSIFNRAFSKNEIIKLFKGLMCDTLENKLQKTKTKVRETKLYSDTRSNLEFKDSEKNRKAWDNFMETVEDIIDKSGS